MSCDKLLAFRLLMSPCLEYSVLSLAGSPHIIFCGPTALNMNASFLLERLELHFLHYLVDISFTRVCITLYLRRIEQRLALRTNMLRRQTTPCGITRIYPWQQQT